MLGDRLTLIGFGVDPRAVLDDDARARWQTHGGAFLQIGLRGQHPATGTPFAEDLSDCLANGPSRGTLVVCRPDRVILHDGPARHAERIVDDCLKALTAA